MRPLVMIGVLGLGTVSATAALDDKSVELDQVIIADLVDFTHAIAFYVDAPANLRREMSAAINKLRNEHKADCQSQNQPHWLCTSGGFRFFRGITGTGEQSKWGYVCADESWVTHH